VPCITMTRPWAGTSSGMPYPRRATSGGSVPTRREVSGPGAQRLAPGAQHAAHRQPHGLTRVGARREKCVWFAWPLHGALQGGTPRP
jgi:hypothetical protein